MTQTTDIQKTPVPYSRTNPFPAKVLKNINLNGAGSNKETRHIELSLKGSGFTYAPGDAAGIIPQNDPELADQILDVMGWDSKAAVQVNDSTFTIREALISQFELTTLNKKIVQQAANLTENGKLAELAADDARLKKYLYGRDVLDLVSEFGPWKATPQEFIGILRKMAPRLYSIASSLTAHPDEVHLTVGAVRYSTQGRVHKGACSVMFAERIKEGDTVPLFVQPNKHFKLPAKDKDIIMIGPGTGIAPFRSFIEERAVTQATGKAWLFFGDQHEATDYLYRSELENYLKAGVLTRISTAFSRDTDKKVYVQHRMLESGKELFSWLEEGAHVYICGDKQNMARDVNEALLTIIEKEGAMSREDAESYLKRMSDEGRYQKDVY